jgi:hypothetical protein
MQPEYTALVTVGYVYTRPKLWKPISVPQVVNPVHITFYIQQFAYNVDYIYWEYIVNEYE